MLEGLSDPHGHLLFSRRLKAAQIQLSSSELKIKGINDGRPIPLDGFLLLRKVNLPATGDASVINWTWDMQSLIDARNADFPVGNPYINAVEHSALLEFESMISEDRVECFRPPQTMHSQFLQVFSRIKWTSRRLILRSIPSLQHNMCRGWNRNPKNLFATTKRGFVSLPI